MKICTVCGNTENDNEKECSNCGNRDLRTITEASYGNYTVSQDNIMYEQISQKYNEDGSLKHINKEDARYHVLWYDSQGIHCSEKNCEINKRDD